MVRYDMPKTTQVAADREHDKARSVLPAEVARGVYIENPPSAEALKLMHLLIGTAGGRMADDVRHELRLADIKAVEGMRNHSRATLRRLFGELAGAVMIFDDTETQCEIIGGFLDRARLDYRHEVSNDLLVAWWFGGAFREMAAASCHWAILDRQTVFALASKYSILLFQHVASLTSLEKVSSRTFAVDELRHVLGVPEGRHKLFSALRRKALEPAIADINRTSPRLTLAATPNKIGRKVVSVTISWIEKPLADQREGKAELDRHSAGRMHRQAGTVERIVDPQQRLKFPITGSARFGVWEEMHKEANRGRPRKKIKDLNRTAEAFREWAEKRRIPPDHPNIANIWRKFCEGDTL